VSRGKPDPEPFLLGAARLGVDPAQCVVVEDAPAGLLAARAAGMPTIAVATTYPAADLDADVVVEGLHQLRVDLDGGPLTVRTLGPA
jgi:sugar-phosphatase